MRAKTIEAQQYEWRCEEVEVQRLFFNEWYKAGTRLTGRSSMEVEQEAVSWAGRGLERLGLVLARGEGATAVAEAWATKAAAMKLLP